MALDGKIDLHDVVLVPCKSLKRDPTNPNVMNERQMNGLRASMKRFGYLQPVIVQKSTMIIADGEHRLTVYEESGRTEVPCVLLDLKDDAERRLLRQTMNKLRGAHDQEKDLDELQFLIRSSRTGELALLVGMDSNKLLDYVQNKRPENREAEAPVIVPTAKRGQLWTLGKHRLMCGDSTDKKDMRTLQAKYRIAQLQTDPPYGVGYGEKNEFLNSIGRGNRIQTPIENDDTEDDIRGLMNSVFSKIHWAEFNTAYIWAPDAQMYNFLSAMRESEITFSEFLIWVKNNHVLGRHDYSFAHEFILYGWKGKHRFYGPFRTTVFHENKPQSSNLHPTMKPVTIISQLIGDGTERDDVVLDPFGGSGSTLIASEQMGRICLTMEIDPHYCDIIIARWEKLTGRKAELVK